MRDKRPLVKLQERHRLALESWIETQGTACDGGGDAAT